MECFPAERPLSVNWRIQSAEPIVWKAISFASWLGETLLIYITNQLGSDSYLIQSTSNIISFNDGSATCRRHDEDADALPHREVQFWDSFRLSPVFCFFFPQKNITPSHIKLFQVYYSLFV